MAMTQQAAIGVTDIQRAFAKFGGIGSETVLENIVEQRMTSAVTDDGERAALALGLLIVSALRDISKDIYEAGERR